MRVLLSAGILFGATAFAVAADVKGSADHPLIPRYEGSEIVTYASEAFTDYALLLGKVAARGGKEKNPDATQPLEGKLTQIAYRAPAGRSVLEVFRNYEQALAGAGFAPVFSCAKAECGGRYFNHAASPKAGYSAFGEYDEEQRYLAARLARPEGDVYVSLYAVMNASGGGANKGRAMIQLDVVELAPMEQKMVVIAANEMQRDISAEGRVAIYGIHFATDSDAVEDDSRPQLDEIAALLQSGPDLKVLIVGHTDSQGSLDYNLDLSKRRAQAVVDLLTAEYGIAGERLTPAGVGMAAPVATNRTDAGRALNRRVELVEQ